MRKKGELRTTCQHDERVFRDGDIIFTEGDLRELINTIYSAYGYKGSQSDKLVKLTDYLALESNRFTGPECADQCEKLSVYLNNFLDFLKNNFYGGQQTEDGDTIYLFKTEETSSETEAFLIEFQMLSMDTEKAFKNYRAAIISELQI